MLAKTGFILIFIFLIACVGGNAVTVAHNTTTTLTCSASGRYTPRWFVNGTEVDTNGHRYKISTDSEDKTATLTINGNRTCETLNIYCVVITTDERFFAMHNTTLKFQGQLPSPENVHINESGNSSVEWNAPYTAMNSESDTIYVDPHITQYTVYITDNYTGNIIEQNVTETQFTPNIQQEDALCPMYRVSAWNAGGEGEMSEQAQDSTPRVPRNILVGSITVRGTVTTNVVYIHINVDVVCTSRTPEFFLITLMTSTGNVFDETRQHQPGQEVADFTISQPQSVDVCTLHVSISAGNSAGISSPNDAVEVDCSGDSTDSTTTTASGTTVLTVTSTGSGSEGDSQQGNSTTLIITITIGVIAAVGVMLAVGIMCCLNHKCKNSKVKFSDQTDNDYTDSLSLNKPPVTEAVHVTTEQTTSRPVAMAPEVQAQTLYSPKTSASTISGRSDDLLLPPSPPVPNLVYTQVNVQQTQVPPPANDDHVQYAQLKHLDKM